MAEPVQLITPHVTVLMEDGAVHEVRVLNPDYLKWDRTAAKHGWPAMDKAPHTWLTFVAWAALRREGRIGPDVGWELFSETLCLQVTNVTEENQAESPNGVDDAVDPTLRAPVPG